MHQPDLHLAGYQGTASILTRALARFSESAQALSPDWPVHVENDVAASGESAASLFASVEQGRRQLCYMASAYISARVPELNVLDLPFSVADRAAAWAALDGEAGRRLTEAVARQTGYRVLGFWDNGFRHISNSVRPIRSPQDCEGLIIRTLDSASYRAALAALGFVPRTIDVKDLVRVVQTGEVHAQENPLTNLLNFSIWRHHPHLSLTGHYFGVLLLVCHCAWFDALTKPQQDVLQQAAFEATRQQRQDAAAEDARALVQLQGSGVQILGPHELDMAAMRRATAAVALAQRKALPQALLRAYLPGG